MKILFLITTMSSGGAERVTTNLANYWSAKGWDVAIVTFLCNKIDFYYINPKIKRFCLGSEKRSKNIFNGFVNNIYNIFKLRLLLNSFKPDVAIGMMTTSCVYLSFVSIGLSTICIGSERVSPHAQKLGFIWEIMRKYLYGRLDLVVVQTDSIKKWINENTTAKNICIIPNPVILPVLSKGLIIKPIDVIKRGRRICISVGRLEVQKGFDLLIKIFFSISKNNPDWVLVILGDGGLKKDLLKQIQYYRLEKRIFLIGNVGNISDWYSSADIFLMSSRYEGFPNALLEALAHGLPSISFNCESGPSDLIVHAENGYLIERDNLEDYSLRLETLMRNENLRKSFSLYARSSTRLYSIEHIALQWEANLLMNASLKS